MTQARVGGPGGPPSTVNASATGNPSAGNPSASAAAGNALAAVEQREEEARRSLVMRAHDRLLRDLDPRLLEELDSEQARQRVERAAAIVLTELAPGIAEIRRHDLIRAITDEAIGFGPIQRLLDDPDVTEVMVNGPSSIYFERGGVLHSSALRFNDQDHIRRIADRIVVALGRRLDEASPMVDARLPDGSRVNVVIPPLAPRSPTITVRKFAGGRHGARHGNLKQRADQLVARARRADVSERICRHGNSHLERQHRQCFDGARGLERGARRHGCTYRELNRFAGQPHDGRWHQRHHGRVGL